MEEAKDVAPRRYNQLMREGIRGKKRKLKSHRFISLSLPYIQKVLQLKLKAAGFPRSSLNFWTKC